jgi:DNA repair exonuclease SbcCD nuclease subunit
MADTHLGYEQYGVRERFLDFSRSFWQITEEAVHRNVDFVVIAGDLFNKRSIDAMTLIHAIEGLRKLKERNIPVIAIEGNHDRSFYRDSASWLQFLCHQEYLILLQPRMQDGAPLIEPWEPATMLGAYVDLLAGKLRVYGLHWQGAAIQKSIDGLARALGEQRVSEDARGIEYRLLMMHTGIDGIVPRVQGLPTRGQMQALHERIDYLALGHVHKPYEFDGWIYNPGSPETCSAEEAQWEDRGYYYVEIDTDEPERIIDPAREARLHRAERVPNIRRTYVRHEIRVDTLPDPQALYARLEEYCRREGPRYRDDDKPPLVLISLTGTLSFDAGSLDQNYMDEIVRQHFQPLFHRIDDHTSDQDYVPGEGEIDGRDRSLWHELERRIFEDLVATRDNRYLPAKEQWGSVLTSLKQRALTKEEPQQIAQYLREQRNTLFENA